MTWVKDWISILHYSGLSENTIAAYGRDLRHIQNELNGIEITEATIEQLRWVFNILKLSGMKTTSLLRMHSTLINILQFLEDQHIPHIVSSDVIKKSHLLKIENNQTDKSLSSPKNKPRKFSQLGNAIYLKEKYITFEMGTEEIAAEIGCTKQAVFKALRAHSIKLRNHSQAWQAAAKKEHTRIKSSTINDIFFSKWTAASAYVFGVIMTDGNLRLSKGADGSERFSSGLVSISQNKPELLEKIARLMAYSGKITYQPRRVNQGQVSGELYRLGFSSNKIVADLVSLGLRPRKSLIMKYPDVPDDMNRHFIRGCWDGDGSVYIDSGIQQVCASYVSGSVKFVEGLVEQLVKAGLPRATIHCHKSSSTSYYVRYTGSRVQRLFHFFYDNVPDTEYLERKFNLFRMSLELNQSIKPNRKNKRC